MDILFLFCFFFNWNLAHHNVGHRTLHHWSVRLSPQKLDTYRPLTDNTCTCSKLKSVARDYMDSENSRWSTNYLRNFDARICPCKNSAIYASFFTHTHLSRQCAQSISCCWENPGFTLNAIWEISKYLVCVSPIFQIKFSWIATFCSLNKMNENIQCVG